MNVKFAFSALACAVVLVCATGGEAKALSTGATAAEGFSCESGLSVQIRRLPSEKIELTLEDKSAVLELDVSGSGERYVSKQGLFGKGTEWQQKGGQAALSFTDPYGNAVETTCHKDGD